MCVRFLLPVLRLRTILEEPTLGAMEERIKDPSHSLSDAFAETICRIQRLPESRSRLGMSTLMWLTYTPRAMTELELSDVLAINRAESAVRIKYRPAIKTILDCCQGLVRVDAGGYARLAHYAIQEYLRDHSKDLFPRAKSTIAATSLRYLTFENFQDGPWQTESDLKFRIEMYPFLTWAARYWGHFTRRTEKEAEVWSALLLFFSSPTATAMANQVRQYSMGLNGNYWNIDECNSCSALHHASRHGLERAVNQLLDSSDYNVNQLTQMGSTPVILAASGGHMLTTKGLLARNANPRLSNWYGDALHCAIESGKEEIVRELVSWGMDPNAVGRNRRTYLACPLDCDSAGTFAVLVELGADIQLQSASNIDGHIFFSAAFRGCEDIVDLMIKRGWVDSEMRNPEGWTAMHCATAAGSPTTVRRLLDAGANIDAMDEDGCTALDHAEDEGNTTMAKLLLDFGATPRHSRHKAPRTFNKV